MLLGVDSTGCRHSHEGMADMAQEPRRVTRPAATPTTRPTHDPAADSAAPLRHWWRVARVPLLLLACAAAYLIPAHSVPDLLPPRDGGVQQASISASPSPSAAAHLVQRHDCWTGAAPGDVTLPGHVVVTLPDGETVYGGERLVGRALAQVFDGADHGLTVHAFCR